MRKFAASNVWLKIAGTASIIFGIERVRRSLIVETAWPNVVATSIHSDYLANGIVIFGLLLWLLSFSRPRAAIIAFFGGSSMLMQYLLFLAAYYLGVGAMMYLNTAWFRMGDVKFGADGWELYWPLWALFYCPPALIGLIVGWRSQLPARFKTVLLWSFLVTIFAILEVSFVLDIQWQILIIEWVVLAAGFFWIETKVSRLTRCSCPAPSPAR